MTRTVNLLAKLGGLAFIVPFIFEAGNWARIEWKARRG
jgi:hypothetical protein